MIANSWREVISRKIRAISKTGASIGSVRLRKTNQAEPPSISAASYGDFGKERKPASARITTKGV